LISEPIGVEVRYFKTILTFSLLCILSWGSEVFRWSCYMDRSFKKQEQCWLTDIVWCLKLCYCI